MTQARALDPGGSFAACLGAVLRRLRTLRGLTQAGLGRLVSYDGSYVGAIERAAVRPSRDLVERCDRALDACGALLALWPLADQEWASSPTLTPGTPVGRDGLEEPPWSGRDAFATGIRVGRDGPGASGSDPGPGAADGPWSDRRAQGGQDPTPDAVVEAMELARRAESSEVGAGTLAGVERAVERLRRAASSTPPEALIPAARAQRRYVGRLLESHVTPGRQRRLLAAAGWLSVLLAQLHFDAGDREAAEANRDAALRLADQAGHAELAAWAAEALAWWALVDGRYRDALDLARAAQDLVPPASTAALQLALDEAHAWTSLGDADEAAGAHRHAALTRAMLPGTGFPHTTPDDEPTAATSPTRGLAPSGAP
jgi:tetratricopeptide (TPR) repeat protein